MGCSGEVSIAPPGEELGQAVAPVGLEGTLTSAPAGPDDWVGPVMPPAKDFHLTLDQSGDLLLAGSSHLLHIHKLYRLSVKAAGPVLSGFLLGQGELMAPVLADEHGLVFYRRSLGGAMRPQRRAATYLPCSTSWTTLKDLFR